MFKFDEKTVKEAPWLENKEIDVSVKIMVKWGIIHHPKIRTYFFMLSLAILNVQQYIQVYYFIMENQFHEIIFEGFYAMCATNVLLKEIFILLNHHEVEEFLMYFHGLIEEVANSPDSDIRRNFANDTKYTKMFSVFNYSCCIMGACIFTLYSILFEDNNERRVSIYKTWAPFDQSRTPIYQLVFFFQFYVTISALLIYTPWMTLMVKFTVFGATLYKCITNSVVKSFEEFFQKENDGSYVLKNLRPEVAKVLLEKMKYTVRQHYKCLNYANKLSDLFAQIFSIEYIIQSLSLVMVLFNLNVVTNRLEIFIHICYVVMNLLVSFLFNLHAQLLQIQNEKFLEALYNSPWYIMPKRCQFYVQMLLKQSQSPPTITVCGMFPLDLAAFQTMINRSYTYYTLLRTLMAD
ncbi:hypothetical protein DMENIID0001_069150 [Sergentomyia squamirostris]